MRKGGQGGGSSWKQGKRAVHRLPPIFTVEPTSALAQTQRVHRNRVVSPPSDKTEASKETRKRLAPEKLESWGKLGKAADNWGDPVNCSSTEEQKARRLKESKKGGERNEGSPSSVRLLKWLKSGSLTSLVIERDQSTDASLLALRQTEAAQHRQPPPVLESCIFFK